MGDRDQQWAALLTPGQGGGQGRGVSAPIASPELVSLVLRDLAQGQLPFEAWCFLTQLLAPSWALSHRLTHGELAGPRDPLACERGRERLTHPHAAPLPAQPGPCLVPLAGDAAGRSPGFEMPGERQYSLTHGRWRVALWNVLGT